MCIFKLSLLLLIINTLHKKGVKNHMWGCVTLFPKLMAAKNILFTLKFYFYLLFPFDTQLYTCRNLSVMQHLKTVSIRAKRQ